MFTQNEKLIIIGSLLHDVGKFEQRCSENPGKLSHDSLGYELVNSNRFRESFEKIVGLENYPILLDIISRHHDNDVPDFIRIIQIADQLSIGEPVDSQKDEELLNNWKHKHLASLFTKINLMSDQKITPKYYRHKTLSEIDFNIIIPQELSEEERKKGNYSYKPTDFNAFKNELESVLNIYEIESDFNSLINLLLILFEKWMWCIPDYIGNDETNISLYNHLKDVAALSHAIYLTQKENQDSSKLNLIIGDLPGIQKYIFDVANKKPAKVLRGRSIYVQILTRNFATKFLEVCGLTESNLIMLAGGKFYIVAPDNEYFTRSFDTIQKEIETYLFEYFRMELSFNSVYHQFDYSDLINKRKTFGQLIDEASFKLLKNRYGLYKNRLFQGNTIIKKNYIWEEQYITGDGTGTDSIKCAVTNKPIRKIHDSIIEEITPDGKDTYKVDLQVKNEYEIGSRVPYDNLLLQIEDNGFDVIPKNIKNIYNMKYEDVSQNHKLLINPNMDILFSEFSTKKLSRYIFINLRLLEVANYCSLTEDRKSVLPFEDMVKEQNGAKYLTLIKGDIDNLGLIMAHGLEDDNNKLVAISQTTTLSNHLKYYFSFFLNGFLKKWEDDCEKLSIKNAIMEKPVISLEERKKVINVNRVYTIFAGGDDLMLIAPQQSSVKLVNELNKKFQEFVCGNDEVHISYSLTNFKDHSPIRIIADIAEESQNRGKHHTKFQQLSLLENSDANSFSSENDKSNSVLFNEIINNSELDSFIHYSDMLTGWINENEISHGLLQKLLELSEMQKKYEDTQDAEYLISYARTAYTINRIRKQKPELSTFLKKVLLINTDNDYEAGRIKLILNPLICQVIYNTRNS